MDQGTALRTLIVIGLVGVVIAALGMTSGPDTDLLPATSVPAGNVSSADLKSCAKLETADPIDPHCAALWEVNRRRFFGKPVDGAAP
ncbi:putative entry exclusion protein TrbK-alt [Roseixanthobacter liquoris]|uniref:putative entry exclusion protein TrbK-alt n=1 Tax=Roseixanthobacter liquoris TaxID=3119921 RepID=UPI00372C5D94